MCVSSIENSAKSGLVSWERQPIKLERWRCTSLPLGEAYTEHVEGEISCPKISNLPFWNPPQLPPNTSPPQSTCKGGPHRLQKGILSPHLFLFFPYLHLRRNSSTLYSLSLFRYSSILSKQEPSFVDSKFFFDSLRSALMIKPSFPLPSPSSLPFFRPHLLISRILNSVFWDTILPAFWL